MGYHAKWEHHNALQSWEWKVGNSLITTFDKLDPLERGGKPGFFRMPVIDKFKVRRPASYHVCTGMNWAPLATPCLPPPGLGSPRRSAATSPSGLGSPLHQLLGRGALHAASALTRRADNS